MNLFVTGATGFVGNALLARFSREPVTVTAAVLEGEDASHLPEAVRRAVVPPLRPDCDYAGALAGAEVVIHLAARVHIMRDTAADPLEEFRKVNLHGTERLARQAAAAGVRRFVYVSTVKVLGEESPTPYRAEDPYRPLDPYGVSKAESEVALKRVAEETGLEVVILRPPLVYGPGVKANFLALMKAVQRGVPLPLASLSNRRSLVYVGNLADALAACALHPAAAGETFLVSDGEAVSTADLVRRMAAALDRRAHLLPVPEALLRQVGRLLGRSAAVDRVAGSLQIDSSKITRILGWQPPFTLQQGLAATAEWLKKQF
ncbi:NAD-dependent epimerase/dehydratase family protein [Geomesophilobacter sediminis]|uniref:NAD-dependent epimerase/dehydratase family protein n=1 Tax=Geomesophilobacter sediminis TaxID=2798584 RepID=A0A8J7J4P9_9BACT|nr:NAD-dependent epimerase/dehydratase family protein [Geomesophilobacter sediminis]MBJ6723176.1 NAD-dependent epimerase/dehydratase family protein [Geomesophilobacter sediminis]